MDSGSLYVTIAEARALSYRQNMQPRNAYVKLYFLPDRRLAFYNWSFYFFTFRCFSFMRFFKLISVKISPFSLDTTSPAVI